MAVCIVLLVWCPIHVMAEVAVDFPFGDNMVLQRGAAVVMTGYPSSGRTWRSFFGSIGAFKDGSLFRTFEVEKQP